MKLRTWLQGAGVAAMVLFVFYRNVVQSPSEIRMHTPGSATNLTVSLVVNLILVSLIFMLLGIWLRTTSRGAWLRLFVPALVLASAADVIFIALHGRESTQVLLATLAAVLILTILLHRLWRPGETLLLHVSGAVLIGLGFYCVLVMFQLLHLAMWRQAPNSISDTPPAAANSINRPRTVWILFDELSYQQVFGDRFQNLELPNFDRLRQSSTLFTDTQPIVNLTEYAIPSIFLGEVVEHVSYSSDNQLTVGPASGPLHPFNAAQTPFALARKNGLTTGAVGWMEPSCGILAPDLNQCYWTSEVREPGTFALKDFWTDLAYPWLRYGAILKHPRQVFSREYRQRVVEDLMDPWPGTYLVKRLSIYQDLMRHADRILAPSGPDFVFLHVSVPHPPNFYDRKTGQFHTTGQYSYTDGLALADKSLGQFLAILQQSPRWKNTNVIVCGDHSWRTYGWGGGMYWTPEDEAASHGRVFDPRPMLMVHLAGQTTATTVNRPFPLLKLHDILDSLAQGQPPAFSSISKQVDTAASTTP